MTKQAEIDSLHAYIGSLPKDSYLRPWLESVVHEVAADIRNDFPVSPALTIARHQCRELQSEANRVANVTIAKANQEAKSITASAQQNAERIMDQLRGRFHEIERLINA